MKIWKNNNTTNHCCKEDKLSKGSTK